MESIASPSERVERRCAASQAIFSVVAVVAFGGGRIWEFGLGLAIRSNLIYIPSDWHRLPPRKSVKLSTRRSSKKKASSPLSNLTIIRERDLSGMNQLKMTVLFLYT